MKKLIVIFVFLAFGIIKAESNLNYADRVGGYFYSSLTPYGTWIEIGVGTVAWRPTMMRRNWAPYYRGQWMWTNAGWYWDSYEPFGHIVYHYGRWYYDDYYGWIWIPDYEWAPAWVEWRYDDYYIGWAPLSPYATFSISFGIQFSYNYYVPYSHWHYVSYSHFNSPVVYNYYVAPKNKYRIHSQTKHRTNYTYRDGRVRNNGIDYNFVREKVGRDIKQREIVAYRDENEIRNSRNRSSDDKVRTYIADREMISRDGLRDVKVERSERKTSLDVSKIRIGNSGNNRQIDRETGDIRNNERNNSKNRNEISVEKNDRTNRSSDIRLQKEDTRSNSGNRFEVRKEESNRNKVDLNNTNRNNSLNNSGKEVKRNEVKQKSNERNNVSGRRDITDNIKRDENVRKETKSNQNIDRQVNRNDSRNNDRNKEKSSNSRERTR